MADRAHSWTDWKIGEIEKELDRIYSRAEKELEEKAAKYFKRFEELDAKKRALVDAGKMTDAEYQKWRFGKIMTGKHWTAMKEQTAQELLHVNQTAVAYVNDQLPAVYARNYNQIAQGINGQIKGYSFEMVDASTVRRLATDNTTLLPYKYIDGVKDVRWNTQKVNSEILQGIIQGDSIPNLAKRLRNVTEMNRTSAIRNARTSSTSAENKGRMDMLHDAEDKGVHTKKIWLATMDNRTRDAHRELDGESAEIDDPFDNEFGRIMYPGDPDADPANVYNCRCTLTYKVVSIGGVSVEKGVDKYQIQEESEESQPVERNYDNAVAKAVGKDHYDQIIDKLDACEYEDVKNLYADRIDDVKVISTNGSGYCSGTSISWNANSDAKTSSLRKEDSVFYHESGHAIDHMIGSENGRLYYSTSWNNGEFSNTIKDEVGSWVSDVDKMLKAEFNEHKTDFEWLRSNGYLSSWESDRLKWYAESNGVNVSDILTGKFKDQSTKYYAPKYSKSKAYKYIEKQITETSRTDPVWNHKYSDISDILEGATKGKIQCGWGHGTSYWSRTDVGVEAFAEMMQAHVSGPESLEILEKHLPKSVDAFRRMVKDAGGKR